MMLGGSVCEYPPPPMSSPRDAGPSSTPELPATADKANADTASSPPAGANATAVVSDTASTRPVVRPVAEHVPANVVYCLARDPSLRTRHLVVYNTGPAVGVDMVTLRRIFEAYGTVERVACPNPAWSRVYVSFEKVESAMRAKAERDRPLEVSERVRLGVPRAAEASDVFAPKPGEPCPLLGRWLKVSFANMRVRARGGKVNNTAGPSATTPSLLPAPLKDFKAFDALAAGGAISTDCRQTPCPLCARVCGGQRGLRMHILDAHPAELRDREHLVQLLTQASTFLSPPSHESNTTSLYSVDGESGGLGRGGQDSFRGDHEEDVVAASTSSTRQAPRVGAGAAAKGKAGATLPPGFAAAREGRMEDLKRLVEGLGEEPWDPKRATDKNGSGPLDWAAGEGRLEVCRYLLKECSVDPGRVCVTKGRGEGRISLHWAARGGHEEVCRLLLDSPRPTDEITAAVAPEDANRNKTKKAGDFIGGSYIDPDAAAAEGTTPLHWACWGAHLGTCRLLVSRGADHRKINAHGCNVAHWCGLAGDVEVCRWLASTVEHGGAGGLDWGKTNLQGHTICHKAALKGHKGLLEWLRVQTLAGVIPESAWGRDEGGYFPRDIARLSGHVDLAEWLDNETGGLLLHES